MSVHSVRNASAKIQKNPNYQPLICENHIKLLLFGQLFQPFCIEVRGNLLFLYRKEVVLHEKKHAFFVLSVSSLFMVIKVVLRRFICLFVNFSLPLQPILSNRPMNRFIHFIAIFIFLYCCHTMTIKAQRVGGGIDVYNFFDNSEGDDEYRCNETYAATRITPTLTIATNDSLHRVVGGYNFLVNYGKSSSGKGAIEAYYQFKNEKLRFLFGSFPRRLMHEQMPDYIICDSIKYFRPEIAGFDFLYTSRNGHVEFFLDWVQKRSTGKREQFMVGVSTRFRFNKFQLGMDGHLYHYALEEGELRKNQFIRDVITAHPYVGLLLDNAGKTVSADLRGGILMQGDRNREDVEWHVPIGFIADADVKIKRFLVHETLYAGASQQYFGKSGFGEYYWGDTFTESSFYSRTDLGYSIIQHKNVSFDGKLVFNFTNKGMQWHQMLTLRFNLGGEYHIPSRKFYSTDQRQ